MSWGLVFSGESLVELRRQAGSKVDELGDARNDYRFQTFDNGEPVSGFVITPAQGLEHFQRGYARRAT